MIALAVAPITMAERNRARRLRWFANRQCVECGDPNPDHPKTKCHGCRFVRQLRYQDNPMPTNPKPLFIPLKTEFYRAFEARTKDTEYRPHGPRWNARTCWRGRHVTIAHGYGQTRLHGTIADVTVFPTPDALPPTVSAAWRRCYGARGGEVIGIRIALP